MTRAEYIKCIKHTHADKEDMSWCGRRVKTEFTFQSIDHAVYEIERGGRLLPCIDCVKVITDLLAKR